jgi:transposase
MTDHVKGLSRQQVILLPDRLDDYVGEENHVRFIDAFVDCLNLRVLGFRHAEPKETGRPPYDPSDLLKLYLYGYLNQIRSSRRLERECARNVELMWLMRKLAPDFKTIADFRKDNIDCIKPVFKEFVYLCRGLGLFGAELIGVDGSKFRAVNSKQRNFNEEKLSEALKRLEEKIARYLREIEANDCIEDGERWKVSDPENLREKIGRLQEKRQEYMQAQSLMRETGQKEVSLTDPDSRLMKNNGRLEVCYNAEAAIDSKNKLIADYEVTNIAPDQGQLSTTAEAAKEALGVERIEAVADGGFFSADDIKRCLDNGITPYVTKPASSVRGMAKRIGIPSPEFHKERFVYDKAIDSYICPAGQRLEFSYWNKGVRGKTVGVYRTNACFSCSFFMTKCTRNRDGRTLWRWEHEEVLEEMRSRLESAEGRRKLHLRKELCEHPFGTIKRWHDQSYLLLKGLGKVKGEMGFAMLAYNMIRAINILGVKALVASVTR